MEGALVRDSRTRPYYLAHLIAALGQIHDREQDTTPPIAPDSSPGSTIHPLADYALDVSGMPWINLAHA